MSYYKEWIKLAEQQTKDSFRKFWETYCEAEEKIYSAILENPTEKVSGSFKELYEKFDVKPELFMGFLDGVQGSIEEGFEIENLDDDSSIEFTIIPEKLYFNMLAADAEHLSTLSIWDKVLTEERREEITTEFRKSRTVRKEKLPGRNDPCPCGSGKTYQQCCGQATA
jgi:uncharacterized protein YecA (UPF0149 family)